jgi:WD40 repeat protein
LILVQIRVWNYATGDCLIHLAAHPRGVTSIAFSADGLLMAASGFDLQSMRVHLSHSCGLFHFIFCFLVIRSSVDCGVAHRQAVHSRQR